MNRLILKYSYPITAVILAVFAWVVIQRLARGVDAIIPLAVAAVIVWAARDARLHLSLAADHGRRIQAGDPQPRVRRRPDPHQHAVRRARATLPVRSSGSLMAAGTDDVALHRRLARPEGGAASVARARDGGRYYSVQFTDPASGANFAYVGKRTTGTDAGEFLLCDATWTGRVADGMTRIGVPHGSALVIGRVFAADDDDRQVAYELAKQIQLTPLDNQL